MAQRATEPAPPPQPTLGDEVVGVAADLVPGDVLFGVGGKDEFRSYKRYSFGEFGATVLRAGMKPRARTRMHLELTTYGVQILRLDYPVRYRRPVT